MKAKQSLDDDERSHKIEKERGVGSTASRAVIKVHHRVCPVFASRCHRSNTVGMKKEFSVPEDEKSPLTV